MAQNPPPSPDRQADDQRAALPDMLAPGMLLGQAQLPPAGQVPLVLGTPQVGGVPFVQGTPSMPGNPPASWQGLPHEAAPSMPPRAASWEQQVPHQLHHTAPVQHARWFRVPHLHGSAAGATKIAVGTVTKWVIVALTAIVVAATAGTVFVLANSPGLSFLNGSSSVAFGDTIHLHGKGFLPGGSVTLTLDNGVQVSPVAQGTSPTSPGSSLMLVAGQLRQAGVSVSVTGTFDAAIVVLPSWSSGKHAIHATESLGSRRADLQFTIRSTPARLVVSPSSLNFPQLQVGSKAVQSIEVGNSGQARLDWTAVTDGSPWLRLQEVTGAIDPDRSDQFIYVMADASQLKAGTYHATISIHSNGGDAQVPVDLNVVNSVKKQPQLTVTPQSLDFGQLSINQQMTRAISVGNLGQLPLNWQASARGTTWLTMDKSSGTVQPGALPQTIQLAVNTAGLAPGNHSATINITSNGGKAQVSITLAVIGTTPTPSPSLTPSPSPSPSPSPLPPPAWSVNPTTLDGGSCGVTTACTVTLTEDANSTGSINWSASSDVSATFKPSSGTLNPGGQAQMSISGAACQKGTFTFKASGAANPPSLTVAWTCTPTTPPPPPPSWSVNPTTLDASCANTNSCAVTLTEDASSTGNINWSASSDVGANFNPPNGTLNPGGQAQVSISGAACQNGTFTFKASGAANPQSLTVSWTCTPPTVTGSNLTVSPTTYDCTQSQVTFTFNGTISLSSNPSGVNITYVFARSDGATMSPITVSVPAGRTSISVTDTWTLFQGVSNGTYWERVDVSAPNTFSSNQATFTVNCSVPG